MIFRLFVRILTILSKASRILSHQLHRLTMRLLMLIVRFPIYRNVKSVLMIVVQSMIFLDRKIRSLKTWQNASLLSILRPFKLFHTFWTYGTEVDYKHIFTDMLFVIVIILLLVYFFELNKKKYYKLKRNLQFAFSLPGESILTVFVKTLQIAWKYEELVNYLLTFNKKYGSPSRFCFGTDLFVLLAKPEDYKVVLANVDGNYKSSVMKLYSPLLGNGIIRVSGATHRLRRKIIQSSLNAKSVSDYVKFFDNYSNYCGDYLEKEVGGHTFDMKPYIGRYVTDIYLASIGGIEGTAYEGEYDELLYWQERLMKYMYKKVATPWLQLEWIFSLSDNAKQQSFGQKIIQNFVHKIMQKSVERDTLNYDNEILQKPKSVASNYLNYVKQLSDDATGESRAVSDEDVNDDIRNLYAAIQNTVMELTSFVFLLLGMHTEIQEKLRKAILLTFGNEKIDAKRLTSIRYLNMVIQETLRLFPVAPIIARQLTGDIKLESCVLPNGCYVLIPVFTIHRNPAYWNKPEEFIPERFSPENSSSRQRYTHIPFGTGLRDCPAYLNICTFNTFQAVFPPF
ncbi:cytochrome P450 4C1-like isoform X1 [Linepithema humile]|uniref:cytochrome P450 4C1-like isoform X1 n=2 Tax=Linepithema humile TaxID=83485 RepID=UPI00351E49F3